MRNDQTPSIISVKNVSKDFILPSELNNGVKQLVINKLKGRKDYTVQHALKDITFEVRRGEFFGIVGRNGSGKSTLLKLLAGIYTPNAGTVHVGGSLTPFIELGVGFNPELTGRENVYMNGALLGFDRSEMDGMYDEIVRFAELEAFMDQKLKNYSSGMQVRLAFSIALRSDSDILLFDEVLAVGDASFQQKCYEAFAEIKKKGTTVVLVTHDMSAVQRFCDRGVLIEDGGITLDSSPMDIANLYLEENFEQKDSSAGRDEKFTIDKSIDNVRILNRSHSLNLNEQIELRFETNMTNDIGYQVGLQIFRSDGVYVYGTNSKNDKFEAFKGSRKHAIAISQNLLPGAYHVTLAIMNSDATSVIRYRPKVERFTVKQQTDKQGVAIINEDWSVK